MFLELLLLLSFSATLSHGHELFVYLVSFDNGSYNLFYSHAGGAWAAPLSLPADIQMVTDFDFDTRSSSFYFSSNSPEDKGLWKTDMTLGHPRRTLELPDEYISLGVTIFPKYNFALVYDNKTGLVAEMGLGDGNSVNRKMSLFKEANGKIGRNFLVDFKRYRVFGQTTSTNDASLLYAQSMDGSGFAEYTDFPSGNSITAFDSQSQIMYSCSSDGFISAFRMTDNVTFDNDNDDLKLSCGKITAGKDGVVYYINEQTGYVQQVSFSQSRVMMLNSTFLPISNASKIVSFKYYFYDDAGDNLCNGLADCQQICLPNSVNGTAVCTCSDSFTPADDGSCRPETLHRLGFFYGVYNTSQENTTLYQIPGDPAELQQEQHIANCCSSDISAIAYNWQDHSIYAVASLYREIVSINVDGNRVKTHISGVTPGVKSLAYDWVGQNLIYYDAVFRWIRIVPIKNSAYFKTANTTTLVGHVMKADAVEGFLFFLDYDDTTTNATVYRTLMDGSDVKKLYVFLQNVTSVETGQHFGISSPGAMSIDHFNKEIWVAFASSMYVLNYNGVLLFSHSAADVKDSVSFKTTQITSMALFNTTRLITSIYQSAQAKSFIIVYSIARKSDGTCCKNVTKVRKKEIFSKFRVMTDYQPLQNFSTINCSKLNCWFTCSNINGAARCLCPDGYAWNSTANNCTENRSFSLFTPAIGFSTYMNNIQWFCFRNIRTQFGNGSLFWNDSNCRSFGYGGRYPSSVPAAPKALVVDPIEYVSFLIQQQDYPNLVYKIDFRSMNHTTAPDNSSVLPNPFGARPTTAFYASSSASVEDSDGQNNVAANRQFDLAFDWHSRILYIADQSNQRIIIVHDNFEDYHVLVENQNVTSIEVDVFRRKLYMAIEGQLSAIIYQTDLDGTSNKCRVGEFSGSVKQMKISYYNLTLLLLVQPANQISHLSLKQLPPFEEACQSPSTTNVKLAKQNVTHIAVYKSLLLFTCDHGNATSSNVSVFASRTLGETVEPGEQQLLNGINEIKGPKLISNLAVFDPHLAYLGYFNKTNFAAKDSCAEGQSSGCDQFCLSSWVDKKMVKKCACSSGMRLLPDNRTCAAQRFDVDSTGMLFLPDAYRNEVYGVTLNVLDAQFNQSLIEKSLSTFTIRSNFRKKISPDSIAFDAKRGYLYFNDASYILPAIYRTNVQQQMSRNSSWTSLNEHFLLFFSGRFARSLFIDQARDIIYYVATEYPTTLFNIHVRFVQLNYLYSMQSFNDVVYAVVVDQRPQQRNMYVSLGKATTHTRPTIVQCDLKCETYTAIVKITDVENYNFISSLAIDVATNRLYFAIACSIKYIELDDDEPGNKLKTPKLHYTCQNQNRNWALGVVAYNDLILHTEHKVAGIQVTDKESTKLLRTIGSQYFLGHSSIVIYQGRKCRNISAKVGFFDENCDLSLGSSCNLTCITRPDESVELTCLNNSFIGMWCVTPEDVCRTSKVEDFSKTSEKCQFAIDKTIHHYQTSYDYNRSVGVIISVIAAIIVFGCLIIIFWRFCKKRWDAYRFSRLHNDFNSSTVGYFHLEEETAYSVVNDTEACPNAFPPENDLDAFSDYEL